MNEFTNNEIIYYPSIEFQSETWLKAAMLFWDKVYRIVPEGYIPQDSYEVNIAKSNGFVKDLNLNHKELKEAADTFENFIENAQCTPAGLNASLYEVRLHSGKIDERLRPYFKQFSKTIDHEGFLKIPSRIANGYLFYLSNAVSKLRGLPKLTDNPDKFTAMSFFDVEGNFDHYYTDETVATTYSTLIIENLIPVDIRSITIEKVIEFSSRNQKTKDEFRNLVSSFSEKISKTEDFETIKNTVFDFRDSLKECNYSKKELLRGFFGDVKSSFVYVGVPASLASFMGADKFSLKMMTEGVIIGGLASVSNAGNELRKNWNSKKSNYYLELSKLLDSNAYSNNGIINMTNRMEEFLND